MTSDELAQEIAQAIAATTSRVLGVGKEQYDDGSGTQKFETLDINELVEWTYEELDDLMVYLVMLRVRLGRLKQAVKVAEAGRISTPPKFHYTTNTPATTANTVNSGPISGSFVPQPLPEQRTALDNAVRARKDRLNQFYEDSKHYPKYRA